ncbi:MAG: Rrf2 family transcriptional regulator [Desulfohalobiaceae bacterium]|nr:Rrf2 family transcriptional regulator [Desulfohalobiaceae bacterium]
MKLSTRSRYGTRMMLDFARHYEQGPVHLSDVADREKISIKYLEQLIIPLKREGLIKSMRGPKGGYILNKAPGEITFAQIIRILENASNLTDCVENPEVCEKSEECPTREVWVQTNRSMYEQLDTVSLADKL